MKYGAIILCLWATAVSATFPTEERVPGGVAIVPLITTPSGVPPKVHLADQPVAIIKKASDQANAWVAIVGIPLSQGPGKMILKINDGKQTYEKAILISAKHYPTEHLRFAQKSGKMAPAVAARLEREKQLLEEALCAWRDAHMQSFSLSWPVKGRISGVFGARRVINGDPRPPHKGIDIAAPKGTPILAAAAGKVINVGDYLISGKTVILDHGQGFKTIYCHLNEIKIKKGDQLKQGQFLGTVGKTGRATGAHLHFGVSLNNERIAPELFFS